MKSVIVIPSRHGSSRFPGKPLALIAGKSLLYRVWSIARSIRNVEKVIIATDDHRIYEQAREFGADVVMTSSACRNGTERVFEALQNRAYSPEFVINLQGDAVLTPPWVIQSLLDKYIKDSRVQMVTPAVQLDRQSYFRLIESKASGKSTGTTVTFDRNFRAMYFSKAVIPFLRNRDTASPPVFLHIGIYGYRYDILEKYLTLEPTTFETAEQLEQLRALENGIPVDVVLVDYRGRSHWSVDNPEDVKIVEEIIRREGELVKLP